MVKPIRVEPRPGYKIWIEYEDGASGEIDYSHLAGKGILKAWNEPGFFEKVHISPHRSIAWNDDIEFCPDAAYMEITGKSFEELIGQPEALGVDG